MKLKKNLYVISFFCQFSISSSFITLKFRGRSAIKQKRSVTIPAKKLRANWFEQRKTLKNEVNNNSRNYFTVNLYLVIRKKHNNNNANDSKYVRQATLGCCCSNAMIRPKFCWHMQPQLLEKTKRGNIVSQTCNSTHLYYQMAWSLSMIHDQMSWIYLNMSSNNSERAVEIEHQQ